MMEKSLIKTCIEHWRWFVASVATTLVIGILFLLVYAPRYERTATILISNSVLIFTSQLNVYALSSVSSASLLLSCSAWNAI